MIIRTHYMTADSPPCRQEPFRYVLPSVRVACTVRHHRYNLPLPAWVCPRPVEYYGPVRVVTKADIMAPLGANED